MDTPVYIEGTSDGGILTFKVYGVENRPSNRVVSFESETVEKKDIEVQINVSSDHDLGYIATTQSAHQGVVARLWKIVTVDGVQQSREIFNKSTYNSSPKIITVGVRGASEEQVAAIKAAAESKNEDTVKAAVAAAKAEAEKPEEAEQKPEEADPSEQKPTPKPDNTKPEQKPQEQPKPQPEPSQPEEDEEINSDELEEEE